MEARAIHKYIRIAPQKCRLIADQIRNKPIEEALNLLRFSRKKAAFLVGKALNSAIANAENNYGADIDELKITKATVDEGPTYKRYRARAKGRAVDIHKRTSHITIVVSDEQSGREQGE